MNITITGKALIRVLLAIIVVVLLAAGWIFLPKLFNSQLPNKIHSGSYQAVTLTTGQQLFGDVQQPSRGYIEVRKAHRLEQDRQAAKGQEPVTQVVPISGDPIEPTASVFVKTDQILAIQPLRKDSVVKQIIDGQKTK